MKLDQFFWEDRRRVCNFQYKSFRMYIYIAPNSPAHSMPHGFADLIIFWMANMIPVCALCYVSRSMPSSCGFYNETILIILF